MCVYGCLIALIAGFISNGSPFGAVIGASGRIEMTRNGVARPLRKGEILVAGDRITSLDGTATIQLKRGGEFAIFPHSSVIFRGGSNPFPSWIATMKNRIRRFGLPASSFRDSKAVMAVRG